MIRQRYKYDMIIIIIILKLFSEDKAFFHLLAQCQLTPE